MYDWRHYNHTCFNITLCLLRGKVRRTLLGLFVLSLLLFLPQKSFLLPLHTRSVSFVGDLVFCVSLVNNSWLVIPLVMKSIRRVVPLLHHDDTKRKRSIPLSSCFFNLLHISITFSPQDTSWFPGYVVPYKTLHITDSSFPVGVGCLIYRLFRLLRFRLLLYNVSRETLEV